MAKMSDDDLLRFLEAEQAEAFQYVNGDAAKARTRAIKGYMREPYGNEQDGRSVVVASDVFDAVEGMLPDLIDVFVSSDKAVVFDPVAEEDVRGAEQATNGCNHVFYKQNNGFLILYSAAKDALMLRTGGVKWFWDVRRTPNFETRTGDEMQIAMHLMTNPETEVVSKDEVEPEPLPPQIEQMVQQSQQMGVPLPPEVQAIVARASMKRYTVRLKTITQRGQVRVVPIPADELEISAQHNSILLDDCRYVAHKSLKSLSDIHELGFPDVTEADVKAAQNESTSEDRQLYDQLRSQATPDTLSLDPANTRGWLREEYVLVDFDGDGIAERRKIIRLGTKVLENEEFSHVPISAWTPFLLTHKFDGISVADLVEDFQKISTDIWRNQIDNLALANNQETVVLTDSQGSPKANIDDLLNRRPGGLLRESVAGAIRPYAERWQGIEAMPMIEALRGAKENRIGYAPNLQALDADALSRTATQVTKEANQRQKRMKLMARLMAEALVKPMFRGIFKTLTDYCMEKLSFRLNGQFVQYDPQEWRDGYDMSINVGIGTGDATQQNVFLQGIAAMQGQILNSPFGAVLLDAEKIYNVQTRMAENAGFKDPNQFWNAPKKGPDGQIVMPPPGPPPQLQLEQIKQQGEMQRDQARGQITIQTKQAELGLQAANDARDAEREDRRFRAEHALELERIAADERKAQREIDYRMWKDQLDAATALRTASLAPGQVTPATMAAENEIVTEVQQ